MQGARMCSMPKVYGYSYMPDMRRLVRKAAGCATRMQSRRVPRRSMLRRGGRMGQGREDKRRGGSDP